MFKCVCVYVWVGGYILIYKMLLFKLHTCCANQVVIFLGGRRHNRINKYNEICNSKFLLTDSRSNKYSSKIEDTRHIHTTYILLQIKYNNIYCTKKEVHSHTQL